MWQRYYDKANNNKNEKEAFQPGNYPLQPHSLSTQLVDSDEAKPVINSSHLKQLMETHNFLKQELAKYNAELVPVVDAIEKLDKTIEEKKAELQQKKNHLSSAEYYAASRNSDIRAEIKDYEEKISKFLEESSSVAAELMSTLVTVLSLGTIDNNKSAANLVKEWNAEVSKLRSRLVSTHNEQNAVDEVSKAVETYLQDHKQHMEQKTELGQKRAYEVITQLIINEQAARTSFALAHYAADSGTSLDAVLATMGDMAKPFANGQLTRKALDAAIDWAKAERGNVDMLPEKLAFKQFINRNVIPHIGSFEALASMVDDFQNTGIADRLPLELLKQKDITFSGKKSSRNLKPDEKEAKDKAHALVQTIPVAEIDRIIVSSGSIAARVSMAIEKNEENLSGFEKLFASVEN